MRTFSKEKTNRDAYPKSKDASDAWVKWSQQNPNKFFSFTEWLERPYAETDFATCPKCGKKCEPILRNGTPVGMGWFVECECGRRSDFFINREDAVKDFENRKESN